MNTLNTEFSQYHDKFIFILLSHNPWLYRGLTSLLPDYRFIHVNLKGKGLDILNNLQTEESVVVIIDGDIFYYGEWIAYHQIMNHYPPFCAIWFLRKDKSYILPDSRNGDLIIDAESALERILFILTRIRTISHLSRESTKKVSVAKFSEKEIKLMLILRQGKSVRQASTILNYSAKNIYSLQHKILTRSGFKNMPFLQSLLIRNNSIFNDKWWNSN